MGFSQFLCFVCFLKTDRGECNACIIMAVIGILQISGFLTQADPGENLSAPPTGIWQLKSLRKRTKKKKTFLKINL